MREFIRDKKPRTNTDGVGGVCCNRSSDSQIVAFKSSRVFKSQMGSASEDAAAQALAAKAEVVAAPVRTEYIPSDHSFCPPHARPAVQNHSLAT